jgi:transposase
MKRFIEGANREQSTLLPESLDDWIDDSNPVRAVDVFVDGLNLVKLGFDGVVPEATGRPSYLPPIGPAEAPISTAISIACSRAGGWSAKPDATWK